MYMTGTSLALFDPQTGERLYVVAVTQAGRLQGFYIARESAVQTGQLLSDDLIDIRTNYPQFLDTIEKKLFDGSMANDSTFLHFEV